MSERRESAMLDAARERAELKSVDVDWIAPGNGVLVASISGDVASEVKDLHDYLRRSGWSLIGGEPMAPRGEELDLGPAEDTATDYQESAAS